MNTLSFDFKSKTQNPFENPENYPALMYKVGNSPTHADVIMENNESSSDIDEFPGPMISDADLIDQTQLNKMKSAAKNIEES
jgi:hypothetical protein